MRRLRMHLNARLFSPEDVSPRRVENRSLGGRSVCGAGRAWMWTSPWCAENIAESDGLAVVEECVCVLVSLVLHLCIHRPASERVAVVVGGAVARTGEGSERDGRVGEPAELVHPPWATERLLT